MKKDNCKSIGLVMCGSFFEGTNFFGQKDNLRGSLKTKVYMGAVGLNRAS